MVPIELRAEQRWVTWRREARDGKPTKVPYQAINPGRRASSTDPRSWSTCDEALESYERDSLDGVGFVFTDTPFAGVDFDGCVVDGEVDPHVARWLATLDSYSEFSPSGTGVKVFLRAELAGRGRRTKRTPWGGEIEVYDRARYFAVTGLRVPGTPGEVRERQAEFDELLSALLPEPQPVERVAIPRTDLAGDDATLLELARCARNGAAFSALWNGDTSGHGGDDSAADLALCNCLAFWCGVDPGRIDSLFRSSGLMREKWDSPRGESTYGRLTIEKALRTRTDFYDWTKRINGNGPSQPSTPAAERAEPKDETPFALTLDEFIAAKSDAPAALIGDETETLLPAGGLLIMFAKGGRGKTTAIVDALPHLASGVPWLGFPIDHPLRVLLIENEGPREPFRQKLETRTKAWTHEITGEIFIYTENWGALKLTTDAQRLRQFITENTIDVVIGDPLDSLGITGVGSPEDTREFVELLKAAGLFNDVAFILPHHSRKESGDDELDEVSGAWGGRPDTMLKLDKLEGNRSRLSFPKIRWSHRGTRPALILAFEPESGSFTVAHEEQSGERGYTTEIEELLEDGEWRTAKEISAKQDSPNPGIGANVDRIKTELENHPDVFVSRSGKDVGRSANATVWSLTRASESLESDRVSQGTEPGSDSTDSAFKEVSESRSVPTVESELTCASESDEFDADAELERIAGKFGSETTASLTEALDAKRPHGALNQPRSGRTGFRPHPLDQRPDLSTAKQAPDDARSSA